MPNPYLGGIHIFAGNFPPRGYAFADGQLLSIAQNTALFSIYGTTYGGDGRTTFALPDLKGRATMGPGNGPGLTFRRIGEKGGVETVTLNVNQIANHTHTWRLLQGRGDIDTPTGAVLAESGDNVYGAASPTVAMASQALANTGGGGAHTNLQPFLALNYIVALVGVYPPRG